MKTICNKISASHLESVGRPNMLPTFALKTCGLYPGYRTSMPDLETMHRSHLTFNSLTENIGLGFDQFMLSQFGFSSQLGKSVPSTATLPSSTSYQFAFSNSGSARNLLPEHQRRPLRSQTGGVHSSMVQAFMPRAEDAFGMKHWWSHLHHLFRQPYRSSSLAKEQEVPGLAPIHQLPERPAHLPRTPIASHV